MIIEKDKMLSIDEAINVLGTLYNSRILDEALAESLYEIIYCLRNMKNGINAFEASVEDLLFMNSNFDHSSPGFVERRRAQLKLMDKYALRRPIPDYDFSDDTEREDGFYNG